jgi:hypothetical protein
MKSENMKNKNAKAVSSRDWSSSGAESQCLIDPLHEDEVPAVLNEFSERIDEWLSDRVDEFDPLLWTSTDDRDFRRKAFSELSLYLHVRGISGLPRSAIPLQELIDERVNDPRYYTLLFRYPERFLAFAYPFAYAESSGTLRRDAASAVERTLTDPYIWSVEKVPHRVMDLWCFCLMYGYEIELNTDDILRMSCLHYPLDPSTATPMDVYALTHNLLFYHNFGVEDAAFPGEPTVYDIEELLTGLLLRFILEDDTDIVAELLAVGVLERKLAPTIVRAALGWLRDKMSDRAYIPGPQREDSGMDAEGLTEWEANYHTNIATAMAIEVLKRDWPALCQEYGEADPASQIPNDDLLQLGDTFRALATYDLEAAANHLAKLSGSPVVDAYPNLITNAVGYLRSQRTPNGEFGFFSDELALYLALGGSSESFRERYVNPITAACNRALAEFSHETSTPV